MRRAQRGFKILARAAAGIEIAAPQQPAPGRQIDGPPLALHVGRKRPALVRALLPANAQPAQVFERGFGINGLAALRVQVFHAHDQRAACLAGPLPGRPEGARVAHVQIAGGRRRKPAAITRRRRWSEAGHTASSLGSRARAAYGQFDSLTTWFQRRSHADSVRCAGVIVVVCVASCRGWPYCPMLSFRWSGSTETCTTSISLPSLSTMNRPIRLPSGCTKISVCSFPCGWSRGSSAPSPRPASPPPSGSVLAVHRLGEVLELRHMQPPTPPCVALRAIRLTSPMNGMRVACT